MIHCCGLRAWGARFVSYRTPATLALLLLSACGDTPPPEPGRPVSVFVAQETKFTNDIVLSGEIMAEQTVSVAFRIGGRVVERPVNVGDQIKLGQLIARLDATTEQNELKAAQAALVAARGEATTTRTAFERSDRLMSQGFTTRSRFDQAVKDLEAAEARVESAEARVRLAQDRVGFTELRAAIEGVVTARSVEVGQTVQPGQSIVQVARQDGRDAVFNVSAQVLKAAADGDARIQVSLVSSPNVAAYGKVREVSPEADPATRTFKVRVGLVNPPAEMRLGATVNGRMELASKEIIAIPASALVQSGAFPAVWVVDPSTSTVSPRIIDILRFDAGCVSVSDGLEPKDIVVSAGVQALHPGQKVDRLPADAANVHLNAAARVSSCVAPPSR
jgi:RND family efflux transporter MFP subunit